MLKANQDLMRTHKTPEFLSRIARAIPLVYERYCPIIAASPASDQQSKVVSIGIDCAGFNTTLGRFNKDQGLYIFVRHTDLNSIDHETDLVISRLDLARTGQSEEKAEFISSETDSVLKEWVRRRIDIPLGLFEMSILSVDPNLKKAFGFSQSKRRLRLIRVLSTLVSIVFSYAKASERIDELRSFNIEYSHDFDLGYRFVVNENLICELVREEGIKLDSEPLPKVSVDELDFSEELDIYLKAPEVDSRVKEQLDSLFKLVQESPPESRVKLVRELKSSFEQALETFRPLPKLHEVDLTGETYELYERHTDAIAHFKRVWGMWTKTFNTELKLHRDYIFQDDLKERDPILLRALRSQAVTNGKKISDYIKPNNARTDIEIAQLTDAEIKKIKRLHPAICRRKNEIESNELFSKYENDS